MSHTPLPAYLIVGEDQEKRELHRAAFLNRFEQMGNLDFDCLIVDGSLKPQVSEIVSALEICPALSPYRMVVFDYVDALSAEELKPLVSYLEDPCSSSILVMCAAKMAKNSRLYKQVVSKGPGAIIACDLPKKYQLPVRVREMAQALGLTIDERAAQELVASVGTSTTLIGSELERLALQYGKGTHITSALLGESLVRSVQLNPWELIDKVFLGQLSKALNDMQHLEDKQIPFLIILVADRLRELIYARSLADAGLAAQLASTLKVEPWRLKKIQSQAARYSLDHLEKALQKTAQADRQVKSGFDKRAAFIDLALFIAKTT